MLAGHAGVQDRCSPVGVVQIGGNSLSFALLGAEYEVACVMKRSDQMASTMLVSLTRETSQFHLTMLRKSHGCLLRV